MVILLLKLIFCKMEKEKKEEKKDDLLTCMASPQVTMTSVKMTLDRQT